jgi:tryptophan synthase alpha chain
METKSNLTDTNRINVRINNRGLTPLLSVFFTAGFPALGDTLPIAEALAAAGVDMLEIGMPYSDPIADGPVIQNSSEVALQNGMSIDLLFDQLADLRPKIDIPVLLMGYYNPMLQYGIERFVRQCQAVGIDGLIIPDLPPHLYERYYASLFEEAGLANIFLISPQTSDERIRYIDGISAGFIYAVSSASITGGSGPIKDSQTAYFERLNGLKLRTPHVIGFGIYDATSFRQATKYADGAIVGTAFINLLNSYPQHYQEHIASFVQSLKEQAFPN